VEGAAREGEKGTRNFLKFAEIAGLTLRSGARRKGKEGEGREGEQGAGRAGSTRERGTGKKRTTSKSLSLLFCIC
jgi:hypothetical protein